MELSEMTNLAQEAGGGQAGKGAAFAVPAEALRENASTALEQALEKYDWVCIPYLPEPIVLERPILLGSGKRLTVHPETVIHMAPGCGGCMVRNANVRSGRLAPMDVSHPDTDILVEGGIWEDAGRGVSPTDPSPEMQSFSDALLGVFFFSNASRFTVRHVTVRRCTFYGILCAGVSHFLLEDVAFAPHHKDGVHVNGPASYGCIRRMNGNTGDDFVALNAWDWCTSAISFGGIHHILVEDMDCMGDELRLLPGRKTYPSGTKTECPIRDIMFRHIHNAYCIKLYQQPNYRNAFTGENDKSEIAGEISRVVFSDVGLDALKAEGFGNISVSALFEICADCKELLFENVRVGVDADTFRKAGLRLCEVGPKSSTYRWEGSPDPAHWGEIFDTELCCEADGLTFRNISFAGVPTTDRELIVGAHKLTPNPDYPNTVPAGGTGYGTLGSVTIE